ncbi:sodium channel protein Nach [Drosophila busckii]|uniref:sodium channel protein Nach n=1 Tax=Drosophila busckii TaxID=30019 RepID=UPI00083EF3E4|nr:sodium channel protein Nach [Drosophila busckii]
MTIYVCIISSERYFSYWVQTTIERTDVHVSEIPFPAISICPTSVAYVSNHNDSQEDEQQQRLRKIYNLVQSTLWSQAAPEQEQQFKREMLELADSHNQSLWNITSIFEFNCHAFFQQCIWRRKFVNCCSIFKPLGMRGSCYVFNSLRAKQPDPTWPWSAASSGFNSALNVRVNRYIAGYRLDNLGVIVQEPDQYLGTTVTYASADRIVVPVHPLRFTAESAVRARPVEMRRCYFSDELFLNGRLRSECINNCHMRYIAEKCNCRYEWPMAVDQLQTLEFNESIKHLCSLKDLPCFKQHKLSLFSMSNIIEESSDNIFNITDCHCFPNCDHIQYHAFIYTDRECFLETEKSVIEIDVYFEEETLFSYRSTLYITFVDLIFIGDNASTETVHSAKQTDLGLSAGYQRAQNTLTI